MKHLRFGTSKAHLNTLFCKPKRPKFSLLARLEDGPVSHYPLLAASGVERKEFLVSCTILKNAQAIADERPVYRLTGAGLPGLEGWLNKISLLEGRVAA